MDSDAALNAALARCAGMISTRVRGCLSVMQRVLRRELSPAC